MKFRYFFAAFGVLFAIAAAAIGPIGVPSFLRLQALGVNVNVPSTPGTINVSNDVQIAGTSLCQSTGTHCPAGAPSPILCTTLCSVSGIVAGQSAVIDLTIVSITNNATLTANNLNFSNLPIGNYEFRLTVPVGASSGGANLGWTSCANIGTYGAGVLILSNATSGWGTANCNTVSGNVASITAGGVYEIQGIYYNTVASQTTTFAWAQSSSNASPTNFCSPDCLAILTRIK
jgi:hypothetical protein